MNTTINTLKNVFGLGLVLALSTKPLMAADAYTAVTKDGDTLNYKTSYEVPVNSPDLIPYAHLEMAAGVKKLPNGQFQFCYHLPWEIVSKSDKVPGIEFTTTKQVDANTYDVEGEHSIGTCTFGAKKSSCHLFYNDLNLDASVTKAELAKKFTGDELAKRGQVADIFSRDPEGILLFEIP